MRSVGSGKYTGDTGIYGLVKASPVNTWDKEKREWVATVKCSWIRDAKRCMELAKVNVNLPESEAYPVCKKHRGPALQLLSELLRGTPG